MATPRVLVIDDDEAARALLRTVIEDAGYEVQEANNGVEALVRIREHRPDVLLLDLALPVLGGAGLLDRLASSAEAPEIPVIVASGATARAREVALEHREVRAVLAKPFEVWDLLAALHDVAPAPPHQPDGLDGVATQN